MRFILNELAYIFSVMYIAVIQYKNTSRTWVWIRKGDLVFELGTIRTQSKKDSPPVHEETARNAPSLQNPE
jgi:hypothetical protein